MELLKIITISEPDHLEQAFNQWQSENPRRKVIDTQYVPIIGTMGETTGIMAFIRYIY